MVIFKKIKSLYTSSNIRTTYCILYAFSFAVMKREQYNKVDLWVELEPPPHSMHYAANDTFFRTSLKYNIYKNVFVLLQVQNVICIKDLPFQALTKVISFLNKWTQTTSFQKSISRTLLQFGRDLIRSIHYRILVFSIFLFFASYQKPFRRIFVFLGYNIIGECIFCLLSFYFHFFFVQYLSIT